MRDQRTRGNTYIRGQRAGKQNQHFSIIYVTLAILSIQAASTALQLIIIVMQPMSLSRGYSIT